MLLCVSSRVLQALLQMVQSHDGAVRSVVEKGEALLSSVRYQSIRDKMNRLQNDFSELCNTAMVRSCRQMADSGLTMSFFPSI